MIGSLPPQKGVSRYTHDLCAALAADPAIELEVLAFKSLYPRWLYSGGDPVDVHAGFAPIAGARTRVVLRWWNPLGWILAGLTLRGDVVHAQWWSFPLAPVYVALLALARLRSRLVLVTLHNVEPHERGNLARIANRVVLPFAHHVIVHTQANESALAARGLDATRVSVVAHGVGDHVPRDPGRRAAARAALRLPQEAPVVLFLGNIRPYKGLGVLLEAFLHVRRDHPHARLAIVGQLWAGATDPQPRLAALGLEPCTSVVLEYVSRHAMQQWFDACDVAVYPYTHLDAQSGAAGEALQRGCPIIVSDVGGLPELVRDTRAIVAPASPDALAEAISRVLADRSLADKLSIEARDTAAQMSWPTVARTTAQLYETLQPARGAAGGRR